MTAGETTRAAETKQRDGAQAGAAAAQGGCGLKATITMATSVTVPNHIALTSNISPGVRHERDVSFP